ncbi:MAG: hypothetical protein IMZ66_07345 [Planctomycetes bacterium]|nr:hypothetical protein [Planctomycetota bacterium]
MPRFVVQKHFRSRDEWHFDFLLECGEALLTFSCGAPPDDTRNLPFLVRQIADHRAEYLAYQGEISGGRGWCEIHDRGTFEWVEPPEAPARADCDLRDRLAVRLAGRRARGIYRLTRETASGPDYWRLGCV